MYANNLLPDVTFADSCLFVVVCELKAAALDSCLSLLEGNILLQQHKYQSRTEEFHPRSSVITMKTEQR